MNETEFNLLHEHWIAVINNGGNISEVSILEVFRDAHLHNGLAGELPTQDAAVLRLLLAVLHVVFSRYDLNGNEAPISFGNAEPRAACERWGELWNNGRFPVSVIEKYLLENEDKFWLFHPEYPFFQSAGLAERNDVFGPFDVSKLNGLLFESDNKNRLFPQLSGDNKKNLTYPETARWLLHYNSFAETFGKLEAKNKVKDAPSLGVGWLGKLGFVLNLGENLFETMMLNLVMLNDGVNWKDEKPVWETDPALYGERREINTPDNLSELYTLISRRILFQRENGFVTKYIFVSGDFFNKENAFAEKMTVWRLNEKKSKNIPVYEPKRHDSAKKVWRDFEPFFINSERKKPPGVIDWLYTLKNEDILPLSYKNFRLMTASVSYGNMQAVIDDVFSDSLAMSASILTDLSKGWVSRIVDELKLIELLVYQTGNLAKNLVLAGGGSNAAEYAEKIREQAYYLLNEPFRRWLLKIKMEDNKNEACEELFNTAKNVIRRLGSELIGRCGPQTVIGREITDKNKKPRLLTAPIAYNIFINQTKDRDSLQSFIGKEVKQ